MAKHAAPALKVGSMRLFDWESWFPVTRKTKWLLIAGAVTPPNSIDVSNRRPKHAEADKAGKYLHGITKDIDSIKDSIVALKFHLHNYVSNMQTTRSHAVEAIEDLLKECKRTESKPVIYYTGHGETGTGDWVFKDKTISIQELEQMTPNKSYYPFIIADCCYSGTWADYPMQRNIKGFQVLAATTHYDVALDIPGGGEFTQYLTNKINTLKKTPVYGSTSECDEDYSSHQKECEDLHELITGHIKGKDVNTVVSAMIQDGVCSAIFSKSNNSPSLSWVYQNSWKNTASVIQKNWNKGYCIKHIIRHKNGYNVIFEESSKSQDYEILEDVSVWISKQWKKGREITSVSTVGSKWLVVMTGMENKTGCWSTRGSYSECVTYINKEQKNGFRLEGYCYNPDLKKHFVFLRKHCAGTKVKTFGKTNLKDARSWIRSQMDGGFQPYLMFTLPSGIIHIYVTNEALGLSNVELLLNVKEA